MLQNVEEILVKMQVHPNALQLKVLDEKPLQDVLEGHQVLVKCVEVGFLSLFSTCICLSHELNELLARTKWITPTSAASSGLSCPRPA